MDLWEWLPDIRLLRFVQRKKMAVEITMRQEAPAFKANEDNELNKLLFKPVEFFEVGWAGINSLM